MSTYRGGRHEHGQNFLIDTAIIDTIIGLVDDTSGPIIEIGPGHGALTAGLHGLRHRDSSRPLTAVEIDSRSVEVLRRSLPDGVEVVHADFLRWQMPSSPHVVVGNLPFHLTTAVLRSLLHSEAWSSAVLLVQWEVARRRAGVGGASMMTAQWWPWVEFTLHRRVSRRAFLPEPSVDGGLLVMTRRSTPLVPPRDRQAYRQFVHDVFTGRGRGMAAILAHSTHPRKRGSVRAALARAGVRADALPKSLNAEEWAVLFEVLASRGGSSSRSGRRARARAAP